MKSMKKVIYILVLIATFLCLYKYDIYAKERSLAELEQTIMDNDEAIFEKRKNQKELNQKCMDAINEKKDVIQKNDEILNEIRKSTKKIEVNKNKYTKNRKKYKKIAKKIKKLKGNKARKKLIKKKSRELIKCQKKIITNLNRLNKLSADMYSKLEEL